MGLVAPLSEMFFFENSYKPITGEALFIGRQDVFLTASALNQLLKKYNIDVKSTACLKFNKSHPQLVLDKSFMSYFGINSLSFMDVSDYEGANIIWDLGKPVPPELHERYDLIFNGSCLDNMFNPAQALSNLTLMLKPHGRIIHLEHASSFNGPYLMYAPGWFFDYYVQNNFADCKCYLGKFSNSQSLYYGPWHLFYNDWENNQCGYVPGSSEESHFMLVVIAEKKPESTAEKQPIQFQYRHDKAIALEYQRNAAEILESQRPIFNMRNKINPKGHPFIHLGILSHELYQSEYPPI